MVVQLYTSAPALRTAADDKPTLLVTYWCTGCCLFMIVWRLLGRLLRANQLYSDDKMMALTIFPLAARQAMVHFVLLYGTNNVQTEGLSEEAIRNRELGSKMVMGARVAYAAFVWSQKLCIIEFYTKLTNQFWESWQPKALKWGKIYLGVSFLATVIALLAQCTPFHKNFQVLPDPGPACRQGVSVLLTHTSQMLLIDTLLALFPLPMIFKSRLSLTRKLCLSLALSASLLPVILSSFKIPVVLNTHSRQQLRSLFASMEIFTSCAVANLIVLLSFVRDTGPKRQKFRTESDAEKSLHPAAARARLGSIAQGGPGPLMIPGKRSSAASGPGSGHPYTPASANADWWSAADSDLDSKHSLDLDLDPTSPAFTALNAPPAPQSPTVAGAIPPQTSPGLAVPQSTAGTGHYRRWSGGDSGSLLSSFMPVPGMGYGYGNSLGQAAKGGYAEFEKSFGGWGRGGR